MMVRVLCVAGFAASVEASSARRPVSGALACGNGLTENRGNGLPLRDPGSGRGTFTKAPATTGRGDGDPVESGAG